MVSSAKFKLTLLFILAMNCKWCVAREPNLPFDWSLYQRLQSLQIGLLENKNLTKYTNADYTNYDNLMYTDDSTKAVRAYNTSQCIRDLIEIQEASQDEKSTWAVNMMTTWGRPSLVGFDRDFGNFDGCVNIKSVNIETQYCIARIGLGKYLKKIKPTHSYVGICVPNSCAPLLVTAILVDYFELNKYEVEFKIPAYKCRFKNDNTTLFLSHKIFIAFLAMVFGSIVASTIYDVVCTIREVEKNQLLKTFSLYTNAKRLFSCTSEHPPGTITCLDGLRAISAVWVVGVHVWGYAETVVINRDQQPWYAFNFRAVFHAGKFTVDTFFVLSAFLAANKMFQDMLRNDRLNIILLYIQRVVRVQPTLIVLSLFHRYLLQFCVSGPVYARLIDTIRRPCERSMWNTLLYINNYFIVDQCVSGSWYLAADMQWFIITPFLVIIMFRYTKRYIYVTTAIILFDSFFLAFYGPRIGLENVRESYMSAQCRVTPWLLGINLGYLINYMRSNMINFQIPKYLNIFLLTSSVSILVGLIYTYANDVMLWQGRLWWSLAICYLIFASVNGQAGVIGWVLSHPRWQPLAKLSFSLFLLHHTVMLFIYTERRLPWYMSYFTMTTEFLLVLMLACIAATVLALTIEIPFSNVTQLIFSKLKSKHVDSKYNRK